MPAVSETSKTCRLCLQEFPLSGFYPHPRHRDGHRSECRTCSNHYSREWRRANPNKVRHNKVQAYYRNRNKRSVKDSKLRASYGIGMAQYESMQALQDHSCAICGVPETRLSTVGKRRVLCVDHCHDTELVRGLLCAHCNSAIGSFRDDPSLMEKAADYVRRNMARAMAVA